MIAVQIAWLLLSAYVILWAARVAIADCRDRGRAQAHRGSSWARRQLPAAAAVGKPLPPQGTSL